jgi:hypothetical protein
VGRTFSYETFTVSYFSYETFFAVLNFKKGLVGEGSSRGHTGRTFKGFADFLILFLRLWMLLDIYGTFFKGSVKYLFLECTIN